MYDRGDGEVSGVVVLSRRFSFVFRKAEEG